MDREAFEAEILETQEKRHEHMIDVTLTRSKELANTCPQWDPHDIVGAMNCLNTLIAEVEYYRDERNKQ